MKNLREPKEIARQIAGRTDPQVTRYFHSSVILDRKDRIISTGVNHFKGKSIFVEGEGDIDKTVHSEVHALTKVNVRRLGGAVIINYARTNVASILARPCPNCWAILAKLGFEKVFYTVRSDINKPVWELEWF